MAISVVNNFQILKILKITKHRNRYVLAKCFCGKLFSAWLPGLRSGRQKSCGCKKRTVWTTKHGHARRGSNSPTYITWRGMKDRCYRPSHKDYLNYGGRGIAVCGAWKEDFEAFLTDMGERPEGLTIDRIDPNGNYEPSNCRWATPQMQHDNRRTK